VAEQQQLPAEQAVNLEKSDLTVFIFIDLYFIALQDAKEEDIVFWILQLDIFNSCILSTLLSTANIRDVLL
jgi:hypothetical protein